MTVLSPDIFLSQAISPLVASSTLALSILCYGFFVVLSVALARSRSSGVDRAIEEGRWGAKTAKKLLKDSQPYFLTLQVGKFFSVCSIGAHFLYLYLYLYHSWAHLEIFDSVFFVQPVIGKVMAAMVLLFAVATITLAVVQLAKGVGFYVPEGVVLSFSYSYVFFEKLFSPFRVLSEVFSGIGFRLTALEKPDERELSFNAEDLEEVIEQSVQAGAIEHDESELLQGALRLTEAKAREVMTPRADIASVRIDASSKELLDTFLEKGFSRLLVTGERLDDVRGVVLSKDLISYVGKSDFSITIQEVKRDVVEINGEMTGDEVLKLLKGEQAHFGVVMDEHGGVDGIITLEDLLEEVVGEIFDETDVPEEEPEKITSSSGELVIDAGVTLAELSDDYGISIPEGEYDTIAGYVIDQLGRIPKEGEEVSSEYFTFHVEEVEEKRIKQIRVEQLT